VSWYQKGKTDLDFTEASDSKWQWHRLGHMQVAADRQPLQQPTTQFLQPGCPMPFLLPSQQRQSTEGLLEDVRF